jgi:AraC family carnitine catabolism transcriptional activator
VGSRFARVVSLMEGNLRAPLPAASLAKRAEISLRALNRLFVAHVGTTPIRYYLKLRLQAARNELFYTDLPIQDVADSHGFASAAHFSRAFTAHFGLSPRAFRRRFNAEELRRFRPELEQQLSIESPA